MDRTSSHSWRSNPDGLPGLSTGCTLDSGVLKTPRRVPSPQLPRPHCHRLPCRMSLQQLLIAAGKTTASAADPALSTDQHFFFFFNSTSQSPVNLFPVRRFNLPSMPSQLGTSTLQHPRSFLTSPLRQSQKQGSTHHHHHPLSKVVLT